MVGLLASLTLADLGRIGQGILRDNFESVVATQRMKEAIERIDSGAMFLVIAERRRGLEQIAANRPKFDEALQQQEGNITEPGEAEATVRLRQLWIEYQRHIDRFIGLTDPAALKEMYFSTLNKSFLVVKDAADVILNMNQDAMLRKSEALRRRTEQVQQLTIFGVIAAFAVGLWFSSKLTTRALRPVAVLSQAVRRLGQGDLEARARVDSSGEIGQLASDFNAMADRLKSYRESSLGELLQAQQASQAAIDSLPDPVIVFGLQGEVLNVNRAAEAVLGVNLDRAKEPLGVLTPTVRAALNAVRAHVLGGKGAYS